MELSVMGSAVEPAVSGVEKSRATDREEDTEDYKPTKR
jgi:hypothetical protein